MFEIKSPKKFIKQIIITDFVLGLSLVAIGLHQIISLYIYLQIYQESYEYLIQFSAIMIGFILAGILGTLSAINLKASNYLGVKLNILSLIILKGTILIFLIFVSSWYLIRAIQYNSGAYFAMFLISLSIFIFLLLLPLFLFVKIYRNREILRKNLEP